MKPDYKLAQVSNPRSDVGAKPVGDYGSLKFPPNVLSNELPSAPRYRDSCKFLRAARERRESERVPPSVALSSSSSMWNRERQREPDNRRRHLVCFPRRYTDIAVIGDGINFCVRIAGYGESVVVEREHYVKPGDRFVRSSAAGGPLSSLVILG